MWFVLKSSYHGNLCCLWFVGAKCGIYKLFRSRKGLRIVNFEGMYAPNQVWIQFWFQSDWNNLEMYLVGTFVQENMMIDDHVDCTAQIMPPSICWYIDLKLEGCTRYTSGLCFGWLLRQTWWFSWHSGTLYRMEQLSGDPVVSAILESRQNKYFGSGPLLKTVTVGWITSA